MPSVLPIMRNASSASTAGAMKPFSGRWAHCNPYRILFVAKPPCAAIVRKRRKSAFSRDLKKAIAVP